eukprot:XP_001703685.1 predicted protein [Chlamydomonas reinhardtii]
MPTSWRYGLRRQRRRWRPGRSNLSSSRAAGRCRALRGAPWAAPPLQLLGRASHSVPVVRTTSRLAVPPAPKLPLAPHWLAVSRRHAERGQPAKGRVRPSELQPLTWGSREASIEIRESVINQMAVACECTGWRAVLERLHEGLVPWGCCIVVRGILQESARTSGGAFVACWQSMCNCAAK